MSNLLKLDSIIRSYYNKKEGVLLSLVVDGSILLEKSYFNRLESLMQGANSRINKAELSEPNFSENGQFKVANAFAVLYAWKDYFSNVMKNFGIYTLRQVFSQLSDSNIVADSNKKRKNIYSKFTQSQLGILSTIVSSTFDSTVGFTNFKKSVLDDIIANNIESKNGPIKSVKALNSRGYGGAEANDKDFKVVRKYLDLLIKEVEKMENK